MVLEVDAKHAVPWDETRRARMDPTKSAAGLFLDDKRRSLPLLGDGNPVILLKAIDDENLCRYIQRDDRNV